MISSNFFYLILELTKLEDLFYKIVNISNLYMER